MTYITDLEMPGWDILTGGSQEADWIADRNRKFGLIQETAKEYRDLAKLLDQEGALFECRPDLLARYRFAADWYVSLAGFSMKTLQNIRISPMNSGMTRQPKGVVESLRKGNDVDEQEREAFSLWINDEISALYPAPSDRQSFKAFDTAFMILGGRVIGQGQNKSGNIAVDLLKFLLVEYFKKRNRALDYQVAGAGNDWVDESEAGSASGWQVIRVSKQLSFELLSGGNRPDIRIYNRNIEIAAGEIKGRKDESNAWESWMPGVYNHLRTWTNENVDRARLFFGTLITDTMITGTTAGGTTHHGLKAMKAQGMLTAAYNIAKVAEGDPESVKYFDKFIDKLDALIV